MKKNETKNYRATVPLRAVGHISTEHRDSNSCKHFFTSNSNADVCLLLSLKEVSLFMRVG
jgi:hypothetical protein